MSKYNISAINNYSSLESFLIEAIGVSRGNIKRSSFSKKQLNSKVSARSSLYIDLELLNHGKINPSYSGKKINIIFEDDQVIILEKPFDVHCHPLKYTEKDNCLSYLRSEALGKYLEVNKDKQDRGLLYRLDYGTSGVLFFIKKERMLKEFRENFHLLVKEKEYLAIVHGHFEGHQHYTHYLTPSSFKGRVMKVSSTEGKFCGELFAVPISYNKKENITLVKVILKTGLRHQIRAQMSFMGFPILGDILYGGKKASRTFLHAYRYSIMINEKKVEHFSKKVDLFDSFFDLDSCL